VSRSKKTWFIIGIVLVALAGIYLIGLGTGLVKPQEDTPATLSEVNKDEIAFGWIAEGAKSEEGSSARVDEILLQAGNDAKQITEDQIDAAWDEAFAYLKQHEENFYESPEVMEHAMYYGEFIYRYIENNAAASNISELPDSTRAAYDAGYNTVKAIKYVYRGVESVEDESTLMALSEAKEALNKFQ
jgi:hypothetical protein